MTPEQLATIKRHLIAGNVEPADVLALIAEVEAMNAALTEIARPEAGRTKADPYDEGFADGWNAASEIAERVVLK